MHSEEDDEDRKEDRQVSAGGVVYKMVDGTPHICLIAKRKGRVWALPKGRVNPGESPEETARREILEETGHLADVGSKIGQIDYSFYWKDNHTFYNKVVTFYLMPLLQENAGPRDQEAYDVTWVSGHEAYRRLSHPNEKEILRQAQRLLRKQDRREDHVS